VAGVSLRLRHAGVGVDAQPRNVVPVAVTAGDTIEEPTSVGLRSVPVRGSRGSVFAVGAGSGEG